MAFELFASLGIDGTGYTRGLRKAEAEAKEFGSNVGRSFSGIGGGLPNVLAGAFGFGALTNFTTQVVHNISSIKDLSEQYQISTDDVQELQEAAARAGLSFGNFGNALDRINESRQQAAQGNKELAATFERLGVTAKMSDLDVLKRLAALDRTALGDVVGVRNEKVIAAIQNLGDVKDIFKVDPGTVASIDKLDDKIRDIKRESQGLFGQALGDFLSGNIFAFSPTSLLGRRAANQLRASQQAASESFLPGVFQGIAAEQGGAFLGTEAERKNLELKKTELELERAITKLEFEKLTPQQQEKKIQEDINRLKTDAAELQKSGTEMDKALANTNLIMAAQKELQLVALKKRGAEDVKLSDGGWLPIVTDALAKVGGFTGLGMGSEALIVEKEQRDLLRDIRENTRGSGSSGYP